MALAIILIVMVVGSVIFHFWSPWWFTPLASNWGAMDATIMITFWVTGFVFIAVNLFLAYCIIKFRHSPDRKSAYEPENSKLETWLTVLTSIGVFAMLAPGLIVYNQFIQVPDDAVIFEAVGHQWQWSYRLPGKDGALHPALPIIPLPPQLQVDEEIPPAERPKPERIDLKRIRGQVRTRINKLAHTAINDELGEHLPLAIKWGAKLAMKFSLEQKLTDKIMAKVVAGISPLGPVGPADARPKPQAKESQRD